MKLTPQNLMRVGKAAGLLEPKSKAKKLRLCLPALEAFIAHGASRTACREYLAGLGISFASDNEYSNALFRARKAGSLLPPEHWAGLVGPGSSPPIGSHALTSPDAMAVGPVTTPPSGEVQVWKDTNSSVVTLDEHGTIFVRSKRTDQLTNNQPSMEDFL